MLKMVLVGNVLTMKLVVIDMDDYKLKHLDLFSGIGGFALAAQWTGCFETIGFCEIEKFPQKLLAQNFPGIQIFEDIKNLHETDLQQKPDVITGGYPCQPFSVAGKQRGDKDDRHLWPEMFRLIRECSPRYVICENVAGHVKLGLDVVLSDLENEGYTCRTFIIPACAKGYPHRRDRVWIVANRQSYGDNGADREVSGADEKQQAQKESRENKTRELVNGHTGTRQIPWDVADTTSKRLQVRRQTQQQEGIAKRETGMDQELERLGSTRINANPKHNGRNATKKQGRNGKAVCNGKEGKNQARELEGIYTPKDVANANSAGLQTQGPEQQTARLEQHGEFCGRTTFRGFTQSPVCRRDDGIPNRVDRIKGLGNAIVPAIAYELLMCVAEDYYNKTNR